MLVASLTGALQAGPAGPPHADSVSARLRFRACAAAHREAAVEACQAALAAGLGAQRAALALTLLARAQAAAMNWDAVLLAQREALRLQPDDPEAARRVGLTLLYALGQAAQSEPYLRQALAARRDASTHVDLAVALAALGRVEEARGEFLAALAVDPGALDSRPAAAAVRATLSGRLEQAEEASGAAGVDDTSPP
jgi:tetratricopeptide (TPR) repeat protein